jgi:hypothetical protein
VLEQLMVFQVQNSPPKKLATPMTAPDKPSPMLRQQSPTLSMNLPNIPKSAGLEFASTNGSCFPGRGTLPVNRL